MKAFINRLSSNKSSIRIDGSGMVQPGPELGRALNNAQASATMVAMDQLGLDQGDARAAARRQAMSNITDFYSMQQKPRPNAAYVSPAEFGRASPQDEVALKRQVSFISISRPMSDIAALAFTPSGQPISYADADTSDVVEQAVLTAQLLSGVVQEAAMKRAKTGERALPLSLDTPRMHAFLAANDAALSQVIQGCAGGVGNPERLARPIHTLVTEYLRANNLLPTGLKPGMRESFEGVPLSNDPLTVFVDKFPDSEMSVISDERKRCDKLVMSVGKLAVSGPVDRYDSIIEKFASRPPAEKRAAVILQIMFHYLTAAEEALTANLLHEPATGHRRSSIATRDELRYAGSARLGDGTEPTNGQHSARAITLAPLLVLKERDTRQMAIGGSTIVTNPGLKTWMRSARFDMDTGAVLTPGIRLGVAQTAFTEAALLQSRAFGGTGLR